MAKAHKSNCSCPMCSWKCPKCGGTEMWFDRTVTTYSDGTEEGMSDRCVNCGERV